MEVPYIWKNPFHIAIARICFFLQRLWRKNEQRVWKTPWQFVPGYQTVFRASNFPQPHDMSFCSPFWCVVWNALGGYDVFHDCPPHFNMTKRAFYVTLVFNLRTSAFKWSDFHLDHLHVSISHDPRSAQRCPTPFNPAVSWRHPWWDEPRVVTNQKVIVYRFYRDIQRTLLKIITDPDPKLLPFCFKVFLSHTHTLKIRILQTIFRNIDGDD